jgi:predicted nuclease of predicted toxin-antitoxin system
VKVRYQADANLKRRILLAAVRQEPALDFSSADQAGLAGLADSEVLAVAAKDGRILVTHDFRTMPGHFSEFLQDGSSPGVLLVSQRLPVPEVVEQLILIWAASDPEEWVNRICRLPL